MSTAGYGASGQRLPAQSNYEAPACVQNAMMTKDKKPFTYTPGGIDLSQIKSERMAKRLARNAQAEGATGASQANRPAQPQSPGAGGAAGSIGAAAMGMPFQVLPPPPPPPGPGMAGKKLNGNAAAPPPPPPPSSSSTLAPPTHAGGVGTAAPGSPNTARKSPTPQRFEPPPMGFRPEIKIPPNPMAALRKVPPPVEKNTFWKDEYVKERSKSPMVGENDRGSSPRNGDYNVNNNNNNNDNNNEVDGYKKANANNSQFDTNNYYQQQAPMKSPQTTQYVAPPAAPITPPQQSQSPRPEFRSVPMPQSPAVNVYTRQTDSPHLEANISSTPPRNTESPFKYTPPQQQQPQQLIQRAPPAVSPLAQPPYTPSPPLAVSPTPPTSNQTGNVQPQSQTVPWRTQRSQQQPTIQAQPMVSPQPQLQKQADQPHPQPIYNNVQQPRTRDMFSPVNDMASQSPYASQAPYQGPKPTNVGSLYIAPLAPPVEPQAQHIVRQQLQQQQQQRDSPMRQLPTQQSPLQQQQQQQQPQLRTAARWMTTQPTPKEQPEWARPEENGNVVPSSLNRLKSPPPPPSQQLQQQQQVISNAPTSGQNFGAHPQATTSLRLQINATPAQNTNQSGPKERIIPIQLEQTPTYTPSQPNFNNSPYMIGNNGAPAGYVIRSPNQFVDQGYNNYATQQQQQPARVMSPPQQLNAPRMIQQQQQMNNNAVGVGGHSTRIIPISLEGGEGTRGPISQTPVVLQNDQRTPPVQSKSFRILQKITDTVDDGSTNNKIDNNNYTDAEPQLQRPQYARQMSAQQAHHSPNIDQMRRMQISQDQQQLQQPQSWNQDNTQKYVHPSEQQVPEPKKYTGSAIPSRSFKILQAMTTPENAAESEDSESVELNDIQNAQIQQNQTNQSNQNHNVYNNCNHNVTEKLNSNRTRSVTPTPPPIVTAPYPPYAYAYPYAPWYPPPPPPTSQMLQQCADIPNNWPAYPPPYIMPHPPPAPQAVGDNSQQHTPQYPPYPYYYPPYYPPPSNHYPSHSRSQSLEYDSQNGYDNIKAYPPPYMAGPYPYVYPVAPSYSQSSTSSRASSVLPDIIITPSTDDAPSQTILQHHIKIEQPEKPKRTDTVEINEVPNDSVNKFTSQRNDNVINMLSKRLENISNLSKDNEKEYAGENDKNFGEKSPINNASPVNSNVIIVNALDTDDDSDSSDTSSSEEDTDVTPKCEDKNYGLQVIKSVTNIRVYNGNDKKDKPNENIKIEDADDDDVTSADGESEIFDEEEVEDIEMEEYEEENDKSDLVEDVEMEEDLSIIYEEDSEMERNSGQQKNNTKQEGSTVSDASTAIEKMNSNDEQKDTENTEEKSNLVTVRLPLKFSFSRSDNDENVATVEVGDSQIESPRIDKRASFSIAKIVDDSDEEIGSAVEYDDDCDVSVTISLTPSSRSSSVDRKSENHNVSAAYPVEELFLPDERLDPISSSSEDVSVSFSLNMRNKFLSETIKGDGLTNNIAADCTIVETPEKEQKYTLVSTEPVEELDFFATLKATKLQAQKMLEQSANYWGKSNEKKVEDTEVKTSEEEHKDDTKNELPEEEEIEDIWADRNEDILPKRNMFSNQVKSLEAAKNSFWSAVAETEKVVEETEEVDFWTDIENSKKSNNVISENNAKSLIRENIMNITLKTEVQSPEIEELVQSQKAEISQIEEKLTDSEEESLESEYEEEEEEEEVESEKVEVKNLEKEVEEEDDDEDDEEDFWSSVEKAKNSKNKIEEKEPSEHEVDFWAEIEESKTQDKQQKDIANAYPVQNSLAQTVPDEEEVDFWTEADESNHIAKKSEFDPTKYPEEPREVDTDEEIDFWAEIEAKKQREQTKNDVDFHQAATFWASRERQNSVDETPYRPVLPKAFLAPLPDEPTVDVSIWAALEAAKGEEPMIIDPSIDPEEVENIDYNIETASVHDPVEATVWEPKVNDTDIQTEEAMEGHDFWSDIQGEKEQNDTDKLESKPDTQEGPDELEIKRSNYRKAMAFFTISVDEQKEQSVNRFVNKGCNSNRNSAIESEQNNWDWETQESTNQKINLMDAAPLIQEEKSPLKSTELEVIDRSDNSVTPTNFDCETAENPVELPQVHVEPIFERKLLSNGLPDLGLKSDDRKVSVKDRINAFETGTVEKSLESLTNKKPDIKTHSLSVESCSAKGSLSRNSSSQRSESEMEEDDSGVTDMNKLLSETDTESESFPELRKMSSYQRAATHSRLFKLLQDENDEGQDDDKSMNKNASGKPPTDDLQLKPSRRKIVHNVSITRKQNPTALTEAETMSQRRERLSLPLRKNISIDADNPSTPASPASPIMGQPSNKHNVSDKLVNELVQSLLLKNDSSHLRNLPMEKLQAAAKRVLEEELDSLENTSVDSTPHDEAKHGKSYADYYDSWSDASGNVEILPSKAFRSLQETSRRTPWSVRCPRVLSSKTVNRDLARVTESPEIFMRNSKSPDCSSRSREGSVNKWRKV